MGGLLSSPVTTKETSNGSNGRLNFAVCSMQGWRVSMEDAFLVNLHVDNQTSCFGVFDGHGGSEVAQYVSKNFAHQLVINRKFQKGAVEEALTEVYLRMDALMQSQHGNKELCRLNKQLPSDYKVSISDLEEFECNSGCTAVVSVVKRNKIYIANAGDSRAVLARQGQAIQLTTDHKPELESEYNRVISNGGEIYQGRVNGGLNLTRALGDFGYKPKRVSPHKHIITALPDVSSVDLQRNDDFLVMACDGIWDILSSQECVDFIYERLNRMSVEDITKEICDRCLAKSTQEYLGKGCDNMTIMIIRFSN